MQNFTLYKNYSQISENYQLKLPIDLDVLIPEDDSVRLLSLMIEELDYKNYTRRTPKMGEILQFHLKSYSKY